MKSAIEIFNLDFAYEEQLVLENIDLVVEHGEFIGIFGPNGGGKTSFLKLLLGLLSPTRGEISLFGQSPKAARHHIGYVPQKQHFDKHFPITTLEVVLQGLLSKNWIGRYSSAMRAQALEALAQVGLADKQHQPFSTLSGGQMQRTLIARALVARPRLLLLDEPTANVDIEAQHDLFTLLLSLKKRMTILMVTHNLSDLLDKADRLVCVHRHLTAYLPHEVCAHFTLGLYHPFEAANR